MSYDRQILTLAQMQLKNQGFYTGPLDGIPGPLTRHALNDWQRSSHVPPTPITIDPPWLTLAIKEMEMGVDEIRGSRHNPRIIEYHQCTTLRATDDETPWCSSFVNWLILQTGLEPTRSAAARSWLAWGKSLDEPRRGCIAVLSRGKNPNAGHVGLYMTEEHGRIMVLGGNQSNTVNITPYRKENLLGYRWPKECA